MFAQGPDLRPRVDLDKDGRSANDKDAKVSSTEINQKDVGAVSHVLASQHDQRNLKKCITKRKQHKNVESYFSIFILSGLTNYHQISNNSEDHNSDAHGHRCYANIWWQHVRR